MLDNNNYDVRFDGLYKTKIIKGEDVSFTVNVYSLSTTRAFDLTGYVTLEAKMLNDDDTVATFTCAISEAKAGELTFPVTAVESALLKASATAGVEFYFTDGGGDVDILQIEGRINVKEKLF